MQNAIHAESHIKLVSRCVHVFKCKQPANNGGHERSEDETIYKVFKRVKIPLSICQSAMLTVMLSVRYQTRVVVRVAS